MSARQITAVVIIIALSVVALAAVMKPELPEGAIHSIHVIALALGVVDVTLVAISFLAEGDGH